jgi:Ca-activated chloride channel family protein
VSPRRRGLLAAAACCLALAGCGRREAAPEPAPAAAAAEFSVLAGSELHDIEPLLLQAARNAGVGLRLTYAGALDIVERVNAGERYDAILPANGAYPALALLNKPLAREKLFYSRVALGVKAAPLQALGWDKSPPTWADIARAAGAGRLRYAMTNPTSSNTGMSALFAVASAVAGKTEDLSAAEVDAAVLKAFLSGQALTAGSSGWLAEAFVKDPSTLDAMVNYEAVILRSNDRLAAADRLTLVYPRDGVISADYPLMLLDGARRTDFEHLVAALKTPAVQRELAATAYLRPSVAEVPLGPGLTAAAVAELSFPNRLEVIDAVLSAYQGEWRRPATSIFVLDLSGSMRGERLAGMREALKVLAGADSRADSAASARYARFQRRERVVLISFSDRVEAPVRIEFEGQALDAARQQVVAYADAMTVKGGTAIYAALLQAEELAAQERQQDPGRFVSVVLLTDGENNVGPDLAAFRARMAGKAPARVFPILFGEGNPGEMSDLAQLSGGRVFDGRKAALALVFKEIRGYQ